MLVQQFIERRCDWRRNALYNHETGRRIAAILPVHILGHPCEMTVIHDIAEKYELPVIEDATESLGAVMQQRRVGQLGEMACFSFNGNKLITTGGGGMLVTDNEALAARARYLTTQAKDDPLEYIHAEVGYNYRLTNVLAAMGCAQMECLDAYVATKRRIAAQYADAVREIPGLAFMREAPWAFSTFWLSTLTVDADAYGMDSRSLLRKLGTCQIQTRPLWQPLHHSPAHQGMQCIGGAVAERLVREALSIPCSVSLSAHEQMMVIDALRTFQAERR